MESSYGHATNSHSAVRRSYNGQVPLMGKKYSSWFPAHSSESAEMVMGELGFFGFSSCMKAKRLSGSMRGQKTSLFRHHLLRMFIPVKIESKSLYMCITARTTTVTVGNEAYFECSLHRLSFEDMPGR